MTTFTDHRTLPWPPEKVQALVADVAAYPQFLPWCRAARILTREGEHFSAELLVHFKGFTERYVSAVRVQPGCIETEATEGPFHHLISRWEFAPTPEGAGCNVRFHIDFQFRSRLLQATAGTMFAHAASRMMEAFTGRALALYGPSQSASGCSSS